MGRLTEDAMRLREEIEAMRDGRGALGEARLRFVEGVTDTVSEMRASFRNARSETEKRARAERGAFVGGLVEFAADLRGLVTGLRQEFAGDLAGARSAWSFGTHLGHPRRQSGAQGRGKGRPRSKSKSDT